MSIPVESVPFSELLRQPTETADRLSHARAVRLRRRESADLVLMSAERAEAEGEVVDLTGRLLASIARGNPHLLGGVLPTVLPWVRFLPEADLGMMIEEFVATVEAAGSVGNLTPIYQLLTEWRHTAEIHADPHLLQALTARPLGDFGPVPRPESG